jgi:hypothetical protein
VPAALLDATTRITAGTAAGAVSVKVALLTEGVLKAMLFAKLKSAAALVLGLALLGAAGGWTYSGQFGGTDPAAGDKPASPEPPAKAGTTPAPPGGLFEARRGLVTAVDPSGLVQITLGTDDKIEVGQLLDVYRLQPKPAYLGRVKVIEARVRDCVARPAVQVDGRPIAVGDHATDELFKDVTRAAGLEPPTAPAGDSKPAPKVDREGIVTRVDRVNNYVEISLGSDDGVKEGQLLHVYRLKPKLAYLGRIKVHITLDRSSFARSVELTVGVVIDTGDRVRDTALPMPPPVNPTDAKQSPPGVTKTPLTGDKTPAARTDPRPTVERFLAAALAGKMNDAHGLLHPSLPKDRVEAIKGATPKPPPLALVQVDCDGDEALAISAAFDRAGATGSNASGFGGSGPNVLGAAAGRLGRFVVKLKRATPAQMESGWFASDWLIADVHSRDADAALTELIDFLGRHPTSQPAASGPTTPANQKSP